LSGVDGTPRPSRLPATARLHVAAGRLHITRRCPFAHRRALRGVLALLAFLLLNANQPVSNDRLIEALWGEASPDGAVKRLQVAVPRLRKTLDGDGSDDEAVLRTVPGGYLLAVAAGELDAEAFEVRLKDGHRALEANEPERAAELLTDALGLWRGPPLAELDFADFAQTEIRRLEELRRTALEMRAEAQLQLGDEARLVGELEALVSAHPTRERLVGLSMLWTPDRGARGLSRCAA
jgi:DNA-binding SARP family transcriptional activator